MNYSLTSETPVNNFSTCRTPVFCGRNTGKKNMSKNFKNKKNLPASELLVSPGKML